jgi:hypothetical protein
MTVLFAAWGGISAFVGPVFGYRPTTFHAWQWVTQNWLLHLVPGAVGVVAGLMMLSMVSNRGGRRGGLGLAALMAMAAGAWFVIGPAAWRMFESGTPFAPNASANMNFLNQVGANLGPGVLLAILGGMALKAGIANPRVLLDEEPVAAGGPATTGYVPAGAPVVEDARDARMVRADEAVPMTEARDPRMVRADEGSPMTEAAPMTRTEADTVGGERVVRRDTAAPGTTTGATGTSGATGSASGTGMMSPPPSTPI